MHPPFRVRVLRGGLLEAVHHVSVVVATGAGVERAAGNPDRPTWFRSGAKPIQALAVVETGAAAEYGLSPEEIAVAAGSHNAEERHVRTVRSLLAKAGIPEDALLCGVHPPAGERARDRLAASGTVPSAVHNNCSGKHAAMLAAAKRLGAPLATYLDPGHPVQRLNRANVSLFTGVPEAEVRIGLDGCSAPLFGVPLARMAVAFARFATPPAALPERTRTAVRTVLDAVAAHPEMVAGEERNDTDLMVASGGRLLTKIGAEGLQLVGVRDGDLGLAMKVEDGNPRAYKWILRPLLLSLGLLAPEEARHLGGWSDPVLRNWRELEVGRVEVDLDPGE